MNDFAERFRRLDPKQLGGWGEKFWSGVFQRNGWGYVPLCNMQAGKAPMQEGVHKLILPDLDLSTGAGSVYVDSKVKGYPAPYWNAGGQLRHGIELRSWMHYREFSQGRTRHCLLGIIELFTGREKTQWSGAVLLQSLYRLGEPTRGQGNMSSVVFWPRDRFKTICAIRAEDAWRFHSSAGDSEPWFKSEILSLLEIVEQQPKQRLLPFEG